MAWKPVASCAALEDGIFATSATCPHLGGSLAAGTVVNGYTECPVRYALFDYVDLPMAEERMP
jgi:nitrite reductase/ring-hydroxylating ferredoxin subunit